MESDSPTPTLQRKSRPWLFRIVLLLLLLQLAAIPYSFTEHAQSQFWINGETPPTTRIGPAQLEWICLRFKPTFSPVPRESLSALHWRGCGLACHNVPGLAFSVGVSFFWTIGLNLAAVLCFGRNIFPAWWRNRPRLPKIRLHLTIERRPRVSV